MSRSQGVAGRTGSLTPTEEFILDMYLVFLVAFPEQHLDDLPDHLRRRVERERALARADASGDDG